jgi:hypothetical protein
MATIWITYAWTDNVNGDVEFVAQELVNAGLLVKLDRWNIQAGKRLWPQIEGFIQDPVQCDAWILYATQNSLGSEPCQEEFAFALDRALNIRGNTFPIIGLFPATVDNALIPASIRVRLYVSLTDPDWKERIKAAAEGRAPSVARPSILPYFIKVQQAQAQGGQYVIEVRPRAGTWSPFFAAIPISEKDAVNLNIIHGPSNRVPMFGGNLSMSGNQVSSDGVWWLEFAQNEATPTQSYYIYCDQLPSQLLFGVYNGHPQFLVDKFI